MQYIGFNAVLPVGCPQPQRGNRLAQLNSSEQATNRTAGHRPDTRTQSCAGSAGVPPSMHCRRCDVRDPSVERSTTLMSHDITNHEEDSSMQIDSERGPWWEEARLFHHHGPVCPERLATTRQLAAPHGVGPVDRRGPRQDRAAAPPHAPIKPCLHIACRSRKNEHSLGSSATCQAAPDSRLPAPCGTPCAATKC
jgi:hypothetical protein